MSVAGQRLIGVVVAGLLAGHVGDVSAQSAAQTGAGTALESLDLKALEQAFQSQWDGVPGKVVKYSAGLAGLGLAAALSATAIETIPLRGRVNAKGKVSSGGGGSDFDEDDGSGSTATSTATSTQ